MRGRRRWPRRDVTAWDPARLGALDRSERPARPRVAHQRSSRPATPPGRTPADSSTPAQETTTAGCEPVAREAGTPAACPRGPRSRQRCRPCSNHRREEQLWRDSGRREAWAIYCSRPAPAPSGAHAPSHSEAQRLGLAPISRRLEFPHIRRAVPWHVSPWSPGGSRRLCQAINGRPRGVRSSRIVWLYEVGSRLGPVGSGRGRAPGIRIFFLIFQLWFVAASESFLQVRRV